MARSYLPSFGLMGPFMGGPTPDPEKSGPPKSIKRQELGTVVGRRGAGISQITGGDQGAHSMNHYGKKGLPGMEGGSI